MKIGYLGPRGSFTYTAAKNYFGEKDLMSFNSISQLIEARHQDEIDFAMVPVENTIEGSVLQTIDQIYRRLPKIQAEVILPIQQQLMVHPRYAENWQEMELICSHPQALAQSEVFLHKNFPQVEIEQMASTTQGAEKVALQPEEKIAAIASREAAEEFGLVIVQENIQSIANNETRFWVLGDQTPQTDLTYEEKKATVMVDLPNNHPGSLHQFLALFAALKINLSKIESRPQKTRLGEYFFIIDLEVPTKPEVLEIALQTLSDQEVHAILIGNYPTYRL